MMRYLGEGSHGKEDDVPHWMVLNRMVHVKRFDGTHLTATETVKKLLTTRPRSGKTLCATGPHVVDGAHPTPPGVEPGGPSPPDPRNLILCPPKPSKSES